MELSRPAPFTNEPTEDTMSRTTTDPTRRERLALARTALAGITAGATRIFLGWLIDQLHR
jgi:hypothetical protein